MSINLALFKKPGRYIGKEVNIVRKDAGVKVALCFPDTYEIGMSHLGLKILYSIISGMSGASAERVFAPWIDFESYLRQNAVPLASLENNRPLKDFDIVGFTLQYELSYTNILNMLDLGKIPVRTEDRTDSDPLVIAGGPCAVNPLPLSPFIDAFVIGDGEEVIIEIIDTYSGVRGQGSGKKESLLQDLSKIEGVYVPSLHSIKKNKIKRRIVEDLDNACFPETPIVPYTPAVHDRISIEISRGCTRGCRFCQAGMIYRPLRERSVEKVLSLSQKSCLNTGYEEISFTSLSAGDYSGLLPLIKDFNDLCHEYNTAISLPSLRVGAVNKELLKEIKSVRKTGFTIAPEAGTKRLRDVINKDVTDEEYLSTLDKLFTAGWKSLKLYFMIGLPTETREDIDGIINMVHMASRQGKKITGRRVNINVGISAFIPKPHTPFQRLGFSGYEELRSKQSLLRNAFRKKGINFKGQHVESSLLEAVFSRGDKDCAMLLEAAWKAGCRFDAWSETFDFDKWLSASKETGIDIHEYASRTFDISEELPWEFIDTGISGEFLRSEYRKALHGETTPDCRYSCSECGLGCDDRTQNTEHRAQNTEYPEKLRNGAGRAQGPRSEIHKTNNLKKLPVKLRVRFSKTGMLRYLSHSEAVTAFLRAVRRAEIPVMYSKGFHPHPKVSFGPPLPVGVGGTNEYFDIELPGLMKPAEFVSRINAVLPEGLEVLDASHISADKKSLTDFVSRYEYKITIDKNMNKSINSFINRPNHMVARGEKMVDIRPLVEDAKIDNRILHLVLEDRNGVKVRLYEMLKELLQKPDEELRSIPVQRVRLYGRGREGWTAL